ncbi:hypothetical protein GCM10025779_10930 [Arthrobacter cryoconiti]
MEAGSDHVKGGHHGEVTESQVGIAEVSYDLTGAAQNSAHKTDGEDYEASCCNPQEDL